MGRPCSPCSSEKRRAIDEALAAGASVRSVARAHGLSDRAVARHRDAHLPAADRAHPPDTADPGRTVEPKTPIPPTLAPAERERPARHDLDRLLAGDSSPPAVIDWSDPAQAAAVIAAAHGHLPPAEREAWLEQRAREQREEQAERLGLRPPGWLARCPF